jgi:hypothetical protein
MEERREKEIRKLVFSAHKLAKDFLLSGLKDTL